MLAVHIGGRHTAVNAIGSGFFPSRMTRTLLDLGPGAFRVAGHYGTTPLDPPPSPSSKPSQ